MEPKFTPVADHGLLVTFAEVISDETHRRISALDQAILQDSPTGVIETVPAMVNILVCFDPLVTDHRSLEERLKILLQSMNEYEADSNHRVVQVCYEEPYGQDLNAVAEGCDLSTEAVINAHVSGQYKALMYGFAPGYAYLNGVDKSIQVPRKTTAIRDIPAGAVLIAGPQCLVTTLKMPTGWSIIGRSPTQVLFDDPANPFLFKIGDEVTFERIDRQSLERLTGSWTVG